MQTSEETSNFVMIFSLDAIFHVGHALSQWNILNVYTFRFGQLPLNESYVLFDY